MRQQLEDALRDHAKAGLPDGVDRVAATDADMPSAAIIGWATLVLAGVPLTAAERTRVVETAAGAQWMPELVADDVRLFFVRLSLIATLTAAMLADGSRHS